MQRFLHTLTRPDLKFLLEVLKTAVIFMLASLTVLAQVRTPRAPVTRKDNFKETIHGVEIVDPYRWLEDQDSPETRAWIDAQNKYTHSLLDNLPSRPSIQKRSAN